VIPGTLAFKPADGRLRITPLLRELSQLTDAEDLTGCKNRSAPNRSTLRGLTGIATVRQELVLVSFIVPAWPVFGL
jgi:hypothetical protein